MYEFSVGFGSVARASRSIDAFFVLAGGLVAAIVAKPRVTVAATARRLDCTEKLIAIAILGMAGG
jgi:hypothetical protein